VAAAEAQAAEAAAADAALVAEGQAEAAAAAEAARVAAEADVKREQSSALWPTVDTPYLAQNGHPNSGFVIRYLQSNELQTSEERQKLREGFVEWFEKSDADSKDVKRLFKKWNDNTGTSYPKSSNGYSVKFMSAIDRAAQVPNLTETTVERAIENVQEAPTETENDAAGIGGTTSGSGSEGLSAPPSPAKPSPEPPSTPPNRTLPLGGAETPDAGRGLDGQFDAPTSPETSTASTPASSPPASPPSALQNLQSALASSQAQRDTRARELVAEQEALSEHATRQRINNVLAKAHPLGHPQNPTDPVKRERLGLPDLTSDERRFLGGIQKYNTDRLTAGKHTLGGRKRRGKGRKSTFRKKRKNNK
jgi:hypothetical protein